MYKQTLLLVNKFPSAYLHLAEQMRRASLSIVLNIAEGSGKLTDKDFNRYLGNALGSCSELAAGYDLAQDIGLITGETAVVNLRLLGNVKNQLGGLSKKLSVVG